MAYNYGSDIASGRADSAKPTIFTSLIGEQTRLNAASKKAAKDKIEKPIDADLKDETKDRLPLFSEQAIQVHKDLMKQFDDLIKKGYSDSQATSLVNRDMYKYQQRINDIDTSNASALALKNANSSTHLVGDRTKAMQLFENRNATPQDLQSLNNPDLGMYVSPEGGFVYSPQEYEGIGSIVKKYDAGNFDITNYKKGAVITGQDGNPYQKVSFPFVPAPAAIDQATNEVLTGKNGGNLASFKTEIYPNLPDEYKSLPEYKDFNNNDPAVRIPAQKELISKVVKNSMFKPDQEATLPYKQESQAGKNKKFKVEGNTYHDDNDIWTYNNINGKETIIPAKKNGDTKPLDFKIYDASGKDIVETVDAKNAYFVKESGDKSPKIFATVSEKVLAPIDPDKPNDKKHTVTEIRTREIPFNEHNADEIKSRYGNQDFYSVRQAITGSGKQGSSNSVGSTKTSIPTATKTKWIESGWSESQIEQGVKSGKIKLSE